MSRVRVRLNRGYTPAWVLPLALLLAGALCALAVRLAP